jgi:hypothetical protein
MAANITESSAGAITMASDRWLFPATATYSITSSATVSSLSGIVRPSAFAVFRLITSSTLVACTTGRSAGLLSFRTRPAYTPAYPTTGPTGQEHPCFQISSTFLGGMSGGPVMTISQDGTPCAGGSIPAGLLAYPSTPCAGSARPLAAKRNSRISSKRR